MRRNERSTHYLPRGLCQALCWLRQSLPPAERLRLAPAIVPAWRRHDPATRPEAADHQHHRPE